jgi:O6-methylguanine-DNA--protein-cysteine methyltransferase
MNSPGFTVFETAIGCCGIVWSERGIVGVQLPEDSARATRSRLLRRFPFACEAVPPAQVQRTMDDIVALLGGEHRDLGHATLDREAVPDFNRRVYDIARTIPAGTTWSYGEIASGWAIAISRATSVRRSEKIHSRSSCLVIASWRRAAKPAGFRRPAAFAPSSACCRSSGHSPAVRRYSLISRC